MCYKEVGNLHDYSDLFMTIVGGIFAMINGTCRIFWGWVNGKFGFKFTVTFVIIGEVINIL